MTAEITPVPEADLEALYRLLFEDGGPGWRGVLGFTPRVEDVRRHTLDDPDFEQDLLLGAYASGELVGSIGAVRRPWKTGRETTGFIKWLHVGENFRRQGVGRALMERIEETLGGRGVTEMLYGGSAPRYLLPGVPESDTGTRSFLQAGGWQEGSERISLLAEIGPCSTAGKAADVHAAGPGDAPELMAFIEMTFGRSWALESEPAVQRRNDAFCIVSRARDTGEVVGFAAVHATNPGWLGPMGVHPDLRGQGMGKRLLVAALTTAAERGSRDLMFPWVNESEGFYRSVLPDARRLVFRKFSKTVR
jgi:GNAT superfamily N-acetyltransferase